VFVRAEEVWAFQAVHDRTFVHCQLGKFELDLSLDELESSFCRPVTRVHPSWLVDLSHVRVFESQSIGAELIVGTGIGGASECVRVPVSRNRSHDVRRVLLSNATGIRASSSRDPSRAIVGKFSR